MKSFVLAGIATAALTLPAAAGGIYLDAELLKNGPMRLPLACPFARITP